MATPALKKKPKVRKPKDTASGDVFTAPEHWRSDPQAAFDTWIRKRGYKASTIGVKRAMWAKVSRWMAGEGKTLPDLSTPDIERFLNDSSLEKEQRYRYVCLLDALFIASSPTQLTSIVSPPTPNPARTLLETKTWHAENDPTYVLSQSTRHTLKTHLLKTCIDVLRRVKTRQDVWPELIQEDFSPSQMMLWDRTWNSVEVNCIDKELWLELRNLALVAVCFGAGVKTGELKNMDVNCIRGTWLDVPPAGRALHHSVELLPFARPIVAAWRAIHGDKDAPLFPAWHLQADAPEATPLHAAAVYRAIRAVMTAAKLTGAPSTEDGHAAGRWGPQTLRNAFAAEHFDANGDSALVMNLLTGAMGLVSSGAGTDAVGLLHKAWKKSRTQHPATPGALI